MTGLDTLLERAYFGESIYGFRFKRPRSPAPSVQAGGGPQLRSVAFVSRGFEGTSDKPEDATCVAIPILAHRKGVIQALPFGHFRIRVEQLHLGQDPPYLGAGESSVGITKDPAHCLDVPE